MKLLLAACLISQLISNGPPRNVDVPLLTVGLETRDGVEITLRHPAYYWGPDPIVEASQLEGLVSPRLAVLKTNTQIRIGEERVDPGTYYLGFEPLHDEAWRLVVSSEEQEWAGVYIPMQREENNVSFLSFVFTPGITDRDFLVSGLFGHFSCTMRWVISGVPSETVDLDRTSIDVNDLLRGAGEIGSVTGVRNEDPQDRTGAPRARPGGGLFRYFFENR